MQVDTILLTDRAWQRFGSRIATIAPTAQILRMLDDGSVSVDDKPLGRDDVAPDVVWATADLFDDGAPLRPFFGLIRRLPSLRWLQSPAAGIDAPIWAELLNQGVRVTSAHIADAAISEYVLRAVLDHYQRPEQWRAAQAEGAWRRHDFREVNGTIWLVIGFGSIATAVAVKARAFGATVVGCRRHPAGDEPVDRMLRPDELAGNGAVEEADVVVICAPATAETEHLVDASFLAGMKAGSVLINIARGSLIDEDALLAALDRGRPEAAILDVTETEPLPADSPLWQHPAVTITPHNSAGGKGRYARAFYLFCDNLVRYLGDRPLLNELRPPTR